MGYPTSTLPSIISPLDIGMACFIFCFGVCSWGCAAARWSKAQCVYRGLRLFSAGPNSSKMEDCNLEGDEFSLADVLG